MIEKDGALRLLNQRRLRALKAERSGEVEIFCAHDVREFEPLSGCSHRRPTPPCAPADQDLLQEMAA